MLFFRVFDRWRARIYTVFLLKPAGSGSVNLSSQALTQLNHQMELIFWLVGAAVVLAISAWFPWLLEHLSGRRKSEIPHPENRVVERWEPDAPPGTSDGWFCRGFLLATGWMRHPGAVLMGVGLLGMAMIMVAGIAGIWRQPLTPHPLTQRALFWAGIGFSLGGFPALAILAKRYRLAFAGWTILIFMVINLAAGGVFPVLENGLVRLMGMDTGLSVDRFRNTGWQPPADMETRLTQVDLFDRDEPIFNGNYFSLTLESHLYIPREGQYLIILESDDGSSVTIDDHIVADNPGLHAAREVRAPVNLTAGFHPIRVRYFNSTASAMLKLSWIPPGGSNRVIPSAYFFREVPSAFQTRILKLWLSAADTVYLCLGLLVLALLFFSMDRRMLLASVAAPKGEIAPFRPGLTIPAISLSLIIGIAGWMVLYTGYFLPGHGPVKHGFSGKVTSSRIQTLDTLEFNGGPARFNSVTHNVVNRDYFQAELEGWVLIDHPGDYEFRLLADDDATLHINDKLVIRSCRARIMNINTSVFLLQEGLQHFHLSFTNDHKPAYIELAWKPPDATGFSPLPVNRIFQTLPSPELIKDAARFDMARTTLLMGLSAAIAAVMLIMWIARPKRFIPEISVPLAFATFALIVLWQAGTLNPDHRYGMNWFLSLSLTRKSTFSAALILLCFPAVRIGIAAVAHRLAQSRPVSALFFMAAMIAAGSGQWFFSRTHDTQPEMGTVLFVLAALCVMVIGRREHGIPPDTDPGSQERFMPGKWFAFVLIMLVAAFLRYYRLYEMPPGLWWDEAQTALAARSILNGNWPPIYDLRINAGSLASFFVAGWFWLLGTSITALRSYYAFVGFITVGVSYIFFRRFFTVGWSLFGMALIAISRWLFSINRVAMATIDETVLLTFLVFIFYIRGMRKGKMRDYVFTGVLLGLGLHLHTGARVLPVIIGADILVKFLAQPRQFLKKTGTCAAVMILVAVVVFSPMAWHIFQNQDEYFKRTGQTLLANEYPGWYSVPPLLNNTLAYLRMYPWSGDWHPRHNVASEPQLPPLLSILMLLGAALALKRFRQPEHRLFVLGFLLVSLQGILTVHSGTANLNRVAENIPIVYLWAVFGAVFVSRGLVTITGRKVGRVLAVTAALVCLVFSGARAYRIYFHDYLKSETIVGVYGFQPELTEAAEYLAGVLEEDKTIHIWAEHVRSISFQYVFEGSIRLHDIRDEGLPDPDRAGSTLILVHTKNMKLSDRVRRGYPRAEESAVMYSLIPDYKLFLQFKFENEMMGPRLPQQ